MKIFPTWMPAFLLLAILSFSFTGCLTVPSSDERISTADRIAQEAGFRRTRVRTAPFLLTAYTKIREPGQPLHIYIEGDGYAWVTRNRVSGDPTPRLPLALELAAEDPAPNVVYLARPCQYTPMEMNSACEEAYWTGKRFSEEVVSSMDQAVDHFVLGPQGQRENVKSPGIHLIGYSGGGTVAVLLAARRQDVLNLRTVAGNLDPAGFNEFHEVSPMEEGSLDPMGAAEKLRSLPQVHFSGTEDPVVPPFIAENFAKRSESPGCVHVMEVDGADHVNGWTEAWPRLLSLPVACESKDP